MICPVFIVFYRKKTKQNFDGSIFYEGWNFNSGKYLFTTDTK